MNPAKVPAARAMPPFVERCGMGRDVPHRRAVGQSDPSPPPETP
jgi:hypothetical protein